jgi:hypothetical protein
MSGVRYDRILASTALALIFAAPIGEARSQDVRVTAQVTAVASVPVPSTDRTPPAADEIKPAVEDNSTAVKPAEETSVPTQNPAREQAASTPAEATPAAASDSTVATAPAVEVDPLASLEPADRPIAEKIREPLGAKSDRIFAT